MNDQQLAAVEARGEVFVSAGAGTGKTSVLVERFVRAVCDEGLDVESVLVITYTRKAAAELRSRIRSALVARARHDLARELDGAWISTIHGFCARLLRANPFPVGIDPRFRELDEEQGAVVRGEAFELALAEFCASGEDARLRLLATYGSRGLRRMLTGVYETLRSAGRDLVLELGELPDLDAALARLHAEANLLVADPDATPRQRDAARGALGLTCVVEDLLDLGPFQARGARATAYEQARKAVQQAALEVLAAHDKALLQELLDRFAAAYAAAKERESALDFEDLQLFARNLLRDHARVREVEQLRFRTIMVDEFQDTNALQCELIDLLAGGPAKDVFFVGDEFQSIYGFRHADVSVFRARRQAASQRLPLTENYRSRPEVLAAVNYLFEPEFGDGFQPLTAARDFPDPVFGHPVELLVTDKDSYRETGEHWRRAEARHIARRVRGLVDAEVASPGEIVLLFAAGTDADAYEEELRAQGLPTYRATGRGYFGQQQVVDLLMYLRLLHNRYDDEALVSVLASPFVGVSNDALVLIRRHAGRRPLFTGIERSLPDAVDAEDERLLKAFKQRYERLVAFSARASLEQLCEQVVCEHDYDLAV
ncbi:MAG: UvrD-helicase domain-containing protein, partial [Actinobacteria bacterium]|nr:UvrD-helicase domain-containing protein [Actinomycetota bacterium]